MKKILSAILSLCFLLSLCACTSGTQDAVSGGASSDGYAVSSEGGDASEANGSGNEAIVYEEVTADVFGSFVGVELTDYSYTMSLSSEAGESTDSRTFRQSGEQYVLTTVINGESSTLARFVIDGETVTCEYNGETEKWEETTYGYYGSYPLASFPYAFEQFAFDEATGLYVVTMEDMADAFTPEQSEAGADKVCVGFKDNECVYMKTLYAMDGDDLYFAEMFFSDYGSTVITAPSADKIVKHDLSNGVIR